VKDLVLQRRNGLALELDQGMVNPALDRSAGVIAKVIAVLEIDRLNQQAQFDVSISFH
jgi:hypothetical protein